MYHFQTTHIEVILSSCAIDLYCNTLRPLFRCDPIWGCYRLVSRAKVADDESEAPDEAPQFLEHAPPSPNYMPGPEHPPSPDYMPGPEHPPSPDYVPGPEYPEYLVPSYDEAPIEDQPLPADASPITLSPGYVADSDPEEDPEEDLEEGP
ncbi:hypothetical protein Tco_0524452 [Tanacetum coccineum]